MPKFKQTFLKPGRYHVGGGKFRDISADDIRAYVAGTNAVLKAGHAPFVMLEHAPVGSDEGAPIQQFSTDRDKKAAAVKHGVGWLSGVSVGDDGAAVYELDIRDPLAAKSLKNGSVKFTSPEFRESWQDGKGNKFERFISHVALTHKPRAADQGELVEVGEAMQFSLADLQLSDGEDENKTGEGQTDAELVPPPAADTNDDAPADAAAKNQLEALLAQLREVLNVDLPADTDMDNLVPYLLTACKTIAAVKAADKAEDAADATDENVDLPLEERGPMQFSLADVAKSDFANPLLAKVVKQEHAAIVAKLDSMIEAGKISPALKSRLLERESGLQFSSDGDEQASYTLGQVAKLLDDCCLPGFAWNTESVQFSEANPPAELLEVPGTTEITPDKAKAIVDEMARRYPQLQSQLSRTK